MRRSLRSFRFLEIIFYPLHHFAFLQCFRDQRIDEGDRFRRQFGERQIQIFGNGSLRGQAIWIPQFLKWIGIDKVHGCHRHGMTGWRKFRTFFQYGFGQGKLLCQYLDAIRAFLGARLFECPVPMQGNQSARWSVRAISLLVFLDIQFVVEQPPTTAPPVPLPMPDLLRIALH